MYDDLRKMSKVFTVLAIINAVCAIPVLAYLNYYYRSFNLDDYPIIAFCIIVLLLFHTISFTVSAVLTKGLAETFFHYDLLVQERIKECCKKENLNP